MRITDAPAAVKSSWRELVVAFAALGAVAAAQFLVTDSRALLTGHFWEDELYTEMMVTDPSLAHALDALRHGAPDQLPPGGLLLFRAALAPFAHPSEAQFRLVSVLFALLAVTAVYALARELAPRLPAFAVALALWSHPLVVRHAFEARYYAPWLAACTWLLVALRWRAVEPGKFRHATLLGTCAVAACALHWFGCLAVGLAVLGHLILAGGTFRARLRAVLPAAAAVPVVLACVPLALSQRRSAALATWIPPLGPRVVVFFVRETLLALALYAGLALYLIARLLRRTGDRSTSAAAPSTREVLAGTLGLSLLPLALTVFSVAIQPALLPRYALPALSALLLPLAVAFCRLPRTWVAAACVMFAVLGALEVSRQDGDRAAFGERVDGIVDLLRRRDRDARALFPAIRGLLPVAHYAPDLAGRCFLIVAGPHDRAPHVRLIPFAADLAARCERYYGLPRAVTTDELHNLLPAYLVLDEDDEDASLYPSELGGDLWPEPAGGLLYELVPCQTRR